VEVTVRAPERDIGTITRVGQDHELQQLASWSLVGGGGRFIVGLGGEESIRGSFDGDKQARVLALSTNRHQHNAGFSAPKEVLQRFVSESQGVITKTPPT